MIICGLVDATLEERPDSDLSEVVPGKYLEQVFAGQMVYQAVLVCRSGAGEVCGEVCA